jgi:hypothetical protein
MTRKNVRHYEKKAHYRDWQNADQYRKMPSTNFVDNLVATGNKSGNSEGLIEK